MGVFAGNCRVTTAEDTKKPDANRSCIITPWKCEASGCDRDCKVEWGSQATGYCDKDQSLTGTCMCKVGSDCH